MKKEIRTEKSPIAIGPYSQAVKAGDFVFLSGQISYTEKMEFVGDDVRKQTIQCLKNLQNVLEAEGLAMDNIVKCSVYLKDLNDFDLVNEIYSSYFTKPYPARVCVQVAKLPKDVKVEIEAMAISR